MHYKLYERCEYCRCRVYWEDRYRYGLCGPFCSTCIREHCRNDCWVCAEMYRFKHKSKHEKKTTTEIEVRPVSAEGTSSEGAGGLLAVS